MKYVSTRDAAGAQRGFTDILMQGLAPDGGLYVPAAWPRLTPPPKGGSYIDTAEHVLGALVGDDMPAAELRAILEKTYTVRPDGFDTPEVTPLRQLDDRLAVLELFHGPTIAFKDVALQLLGQLFDHQLRKTGETMTVLGATSGDTGSAAIEGCRHASGATIHILYPHERPSDVQRRQMTTLGADNVHALAIEGTFDDCQKIVKTLFGDANFRHERRLSAVNSINWARIAAQAVYYVHTAYKYPDPVTFVVPTGNFGNVYAAYAAMKMGAPIRRLIVASNRNDILTRFFETGTMKTGTVEPSLSPSMDIQVSSNFERLLFELMDRDASALKGVMDEFAATGHFSVPPAQLQTAWTSFTGARCDDDDTLAAIACTYRDYDYLIDPHTAVAVHAYESLKDSIEGPAVVLGCAHPAKFPEAVEKATGIRPALPDALADLYERKEHFTVLPAEAAAVKDFIENH